MASEITLYGKEIMLKTCANEAWHEFHRDYTPDPAMDTEPYCYDFELCENNYRSKTGDSARLYFAIIHREKVIGIIYLKHINNVKKTAEFGIAFSVDSVKGRGFGTEAIKLLADHVFNTMGFDTLLADTVLRNTRSQHVLTKIGFTFTREDDAFKYYELKRAQFNAQTPTEAI